MTICDIHRVARGLVVQVIHAQVRGAPPVIPCAEAEIVRLTVQILVRNKLLKMLSAQQIDAFRDANPAVARGIGHYLQKCLRTNSVAVPTVQHVAETFATEGISYAAFKGPARQLALGRDMCDRPAADIDILVHHRDFNRAISILLDEGFFIPRIADNLWWRHFLGQMPLWPRRGDRSNIDLHHRMQGVGCPRPRSIDAFLRDLAWVKFGGQPVATFGLPATAAVIVMSVIKGIANGESFGAHALDLSLLLSSTDQENKDRIALFVNAQGLGRCFGLALLAGEMLTGLQLGASPDQYIRDERLLSLMLTPDDNSFGRPSQPTMLWHLVDDRSILTRTSNLMRELAWTSSAEVVRRAQEKLSTPAEEQATLPATGN